MQDVKADRLYHEFAVDQVAYGGGRRLFEPRDALALISRAAEEGVPVVALDGLGLGGRRTESPPEHSVDYSAAVAQGHGCWAEADAFVRARRGEGLVFEVTLGDDPIEVV